MPNHTNDGDQKWEAHDRYGNRIYMTLERWRHVLESRPWLASLRSEILDTVRHGRRKQDPLDSTKYKYYHPCSELLPEYNHLVVVVRLTENEDETGQIIANNFVLTAWAVFIYGKK